MNKLKTKQVQQIPHIKAIHNNMNFESHFPKKIIIDAAIFHVVLHWDINIMCCQR